MIKGYLITILEKNQLVGNNMPDGTFYNPVQDINGDWFIFKQAFEGKIQEINVWENDLLLEIDNIETDLNNYYVV